MGKQLCFFASPFDLKTLFYKIMETDAVVLSLFGEALNFEVILNKIESDYKGITFGESHLYIAHSNSKLVYTSFDAHKRIDQLRSETIQFNACTQIPKRILDISSVNDHFRKGDFIVIHDTDEHQRRMDELMKNPIYIDNPNYINNGFEHGRFWYESWYYDDCGNRVYKSKEMDGLYKLIANYIRKFYTQSKNRFGYIAPCAYQEYISGNFIPCSGNHAIEF